MVYATYLYARLLKRNRQETYTSKNANRVLEYASLILQIMFIFGYAAVFVYSLAVDPPLTLLVIAGIFFFGAVFVLISVKAQSSITGQLHDKTMEVMRTFVNAIDMKDTYTKGHSQHVYRVTELFYEVLPENIKSGINRSMLLDAALLHDIGKLSIKDEVLNKPGPLDEEDWATMKTHPENGKKILDDTSFSGISEWVLYHHERMDGRGYLKLQGDQIPIESRIIAIADTYSALCTDRIYRPRKQHEKAIEIMLNATVDQLDAALVGYFTNISKKSLEKLLYDLELVEPKEPGNVAA